MSFLKAVYKFQLQKTTGKNQFLINKIYKVGNNDYLNEFFTVLNSITYRRLHPIGLFTDYVIYSFRYGDDRFKNRLITFNTGQIIHPFGEISIPGKSECILGKEVEKDTFEFYVFDGDINYTATFLNMLMDGSFSDAIDQLLKKII